MRESANFCENRLFHALKRVNAPFTTTLSFPPIPFRTDAKTEVDCPLWTGGDVKTK